MPGEGDDLDPEVEDPTEGVLRRRFLQAGGATAGVAATAAAADQFASTAAAREDTVVVFNTGEKTVTLVDAERREAVGTRYAGTTASFPANQYPPAESDALWLNVDGGVRALDPVSLRTRALVETGAEANWQERTPDGDHVVVSARDPVHAHFRVDADPGSESFGEVTASVERDGTPGPSSVTIDPTGTYAYVADVYDDALTVLHVPDFRVAARVDVPARGETSRPWMTALSAGGGTLTVQADGDGRGAVHVFALDDPARPRHRGTVTPAEGLGDLPLGAFVGRDGDRAFVLTARSRAVNVLDLDAGRVTDEIPLGGEAFVGTWGPRRDALYVPVQTADEVAVVDPDSQSVTDRIPTGRKPYGATTARVRPDTGAGADALAALSSVGLSPEDAEATYCVGNCHCGIHKDDHNHL